jgi:hypothetical protein
MTSGFKDMFPVLWSAMDVNVPMTRYINQSNTRLFISDVSHAEHWHDIVATFSLTSEWVRNSSVGTGFSKVLTRKPRAKAWNDLMKTMKEHMYENVDTDTFIL